MKVEHKRLKRLPNNSVNACHGRADVEKSKEQGHGKQACAAGAWREAGQ